MSDFRRGAGGWREAATREERAEVAAIDKLIERIDDERRDLASRRSRIVNRCVQRVKRDAVA